jgi:subtilisin family serine protease
LDHGLNINNAEQDTATGNADVSPDKIGPLPKPNLTPIHGTHVAGIIASKQYGIAKNVQIMMLKTNGNIRELRDKSLAKAIRFAVDHGAKIINCSFGKPYTWAKKEVDGAIAYAKQKDVLILHAAGNNGENNDVSPNYPDPDDKSNWIEVGASDEKGNAANFSNYGKKKTDVFAPGVNIYSTLPGNKYGYQSGTSMATPVVAGLAAMIRGYYPKLTTFQVKDIIMRSVVKRENLKDKCVSGGIINAYNALKLAATYK